jgi:hypothetical protein
MRFIRSQFLDNPASYTRALLSSRLVKHSRGSGAVKALVAASTSAVLDYPASSAPAARRRCSDSRLLALEPLQPIKMTSARHKNYHVDKSVDSSIINLASGSGHGCFPLTRPA